MTSAETSIARRKRLGLPNYQEAYPCLVLIDARRAFDEGRPICVWSKAGGRRLGHAMLSLAGEGMLLRYRVFLARGVPEQTGEEVLTFQSVSIGLGRQRQMLTCAGCGQPKARLFLDQVWRCKECHGLQYRSSAIGSKILKRERYDNLRDKISKGRPKGMHARTYDRLKSELKDLRVEIRSASYFVASTSYEDQVEASWRSVEEDSDWALLPYFGVTEWPDDD